MSSFCLPLTIIPYGAFNVLVELGQTPTSVLVSWWYSIPCVVTVIIMQQPPAEPQPVLFPNKSSSLHDLDTKTTCNGHFDKVDMCLM